MTDQATGLQSVADRYGVSISAVRHLVQALEAGHGRMAQFNHPELGGFGQWSGRGMTMIGDMFNSQLKAQVDSLCAELASSLPAAGWSDPARPASGWPTDWGAPATSGSQNGLRYAYFPERHRLAVESDGTVALYDTTGYDIGGVSQQQGSTTNLRFSGRGGTVDLSSLRRLDEGAPEVRPFEPEPFEPEPFEPKPFEPASREPEPMRGSSAPPPSAESAPAQATPGDILGTIERLAELRRKDILTDAEFAAKKAELLARL